MRCDRIGVHSHWVWGGLLAAIAGISGCGDDSGSGGGETTVGGGGASTVTGGATSSSSTGGVVGLGGATGATTGGASAAMGGAGLGSGGSSSAHTTAATPALLSNIPATAAREFSSTTEGNGLALKSLNLVTDEVTAYTEWFGEVINNGSTVICFPQVDFTFKSAAGVALWSETTYAYAAPYLGTLDTSIACLGPGESGGFWSNELSTVRPTDVASVSIVFDGMHTTGTKFSQVITSNVIEDAIYQDGNHWAMSGKLTPSQTIYNVGITAFTKSTSGLLTGHLSDTNLGTIAANTAWTFDSQLGVKGPKPASLLVFDSFILGSSSSSYGLQQIPDVVKSPKLAARMAALRAERQATEERYQAATAAR
ncbi:MAG: hypothetical protein QM784_09235 [Polyangiaceae bacterium]